MDVTKKYPAVNLDKGSILFQSGEFQKVYSDLNGRYILQEKKKISQELLMTCRAFFFVPSSTILFIS